MIQEHNQKKAKSIENNFFSEKFTRKKKNHHTQFQMVIWQFNFLKEKTPIKSTSTNNIIFSLAT